MSIKFVNFSGHLGLEKGGERVYVYRCLLHLNDRLLRKLIPSYMELPGDKRIQKVLFPFLPVLQLGREIFSGVDRDLFDPVDRDDINPQNHSQTGVFQWRYSKWQIYEFVGELSAKDCSLPGIWATIPIKIDERPENLRFIDEDTRLPEVPMIPDPDTLEEPEPWDANNDKPTKQTPPPGFGP